MAFFSLVARAVTTSVSLAGHPPPFRTDKIARHRRCLIVGWSHQRLPGSLLLRKSTMQAICLHQRSFRCDVCGHFRCCPDILPPMS